MRSRKATRSPHANAVAIFARAPVAGRAKTRLIPLLGREGTASFQAALLADTVRKVEALPAAVARYLFLAGPASSAAPRPAKQFPTVAERGADLGERLGRAFRLLLGRCARAVIIGTDSPSLSTATLRLALAELRTCDAVVGPCPDGGYYLIGLRRFPPGLLNRVRWSSAFTFRDTLASLLARGLSCSVLPELEDIDRPRDFKRLAARLRRNDGGARRLAPAVWRFIRDRS